MSVQIKRLNNLNLLNLSSWTVGSGGAPKFSANGTDAENSRFYATGPYGEQVLVWGTSPTGGNDADGGWNGDQFLADRTKLHRFSVWVRRTSDTSGGTVYMGCYTNGTNQVVELHTGAVNTNPYWDYRSTLFYNKDQWYLIVGHIHPSSTAVPSAPHPNSGIWTRNGGKVSALVGNVPYDCKFPADATTLMNRTYHYYCPDTTTRMQFYSPRIEVVDENTPTIDHLLNIDLTSPNAYPEAIVYSNSSAQSTSSSDTFSDNGELISVTSYTSSGTFTWVKPVNCSNVLVRVVGGGGGAAGYCESGGAGGFSEKLINVDGINTVTVTVGGGGGAVGYYAAAGDGGTSSFGPWLSATGGYGANRNLSHTGGYGGTGSGGDINLSGGTGTGHSNSHSSGAVARGGSNYFGGGTATFRNNGGGRFGTAAPGNGGAGGRTDAGYAGGAGTAGAVIIWEYK